MTCTACLRDKPIKAKGLCAPCYQRKRKSGTTDYQRTRTGCSVGGCDKPAVSHGLCDTHRKRMERHGHIDETRPDSWGAKERHPLSHSWRYLRRFRGQGGMASEWRNDFLQFVADVGERPSSKHKLFAANDSEPIGPRNFVWKLSITQKAAGEDPATYGRRVGKVYRAVRGEAFKGYDLKKKYGLSFEQYEAMHRAQYGLCLICAKPETAIIRGQLTTLAVDHSHDDGRIRGLLCSQCNTGLGCFKDDPDLLARAIEYLTIPQY